MALIAISGQPGCRFEEVARLASRRLNFELVTQSRMVSLIDEELGGGVVVPDKAYLDVLASIVGRLATEHHLVLSASGAEWLHSHFPKMMRVRVIAKDAVRTGSLMLERRLDRPEARKLLRELDSAERTVRQRRFGKSAAPHHFDLLLNAESLASEQMAELVEAAARGLGLPEQGYLAQAVEAQLQFQMRLRLSQHGIVPPGKARLQPRVFAHHSERIFATLLDFYRIAWEYEPRSFPIRFDADGRVLESFTPDFYLPEFDLYVELTTMKQSLVTKKNRKVRRLRELYPNINIRVYYQKDIENLIFKYGLTDRPVNV